MQTRKFVQNTVNDLLDGRCNKIHKVVMIVRRCVWTVRELHQLYIVICLAYLQDGEDLIQVKAEEVTYIQEEDPLAVTFPAMKAEQGVSCISVCSAFTDVQLY